MNTATITSSTMSPEGVSDLMPGSGTSTGQGTVTMAEGQAGTERSAQKLSIIMFSGTADRMQAVASLVAGAVASGVETHLLLKSWGLNAFRKAVAGEPLPMPEHGGHETVLLDRIMERNGTAAWEELLRSSLESGGLHIHACAETIEMMLLRKEDLDPLVGDVIDAAGFIELSRGGQLIFI
ncbi:MAG: DsrE/DsrF/DrsH-like family protein [Acidimicrobiales bacterium]